MKKNLIWELYYGGRLQVEPDGSNYPWESGFIVHGKAVKPKGNSVSCPATEIIRINHYCVNLDCTLSFFGGGCFVLFSENVTSHSCGEGIRVDHYLFKKGVFSLNTCSNSSDYSFLELCKTTEKTRASGLWWLQAEMERREGSRRSCSKRKVFALLTFHGQQICG